MPAKFNVPGDPSARGRQSRQGIRPPLTSGEMLSSPAVDDECEPRVPPMSASTGFPLDVSWARTAVPPTERELDILRREVDPQRLILG